MNSKYLAKSIGLLLFWVAGALQPPALPGYELFIYRRFEQKSLLGPDKKVIIQGEFFGQLQLPSTYPSYNDLSGAEDRWNFGFRGVIFLTGTTALDFQLVTHDDGRQRTKFDWHFSVHQRIFEHLRLILGHDSDHDSEHTSSLNGKPYYTNRNYIGFSLPFQGKNYVIEPFAWFFHHTNQRTYLDLSGGKVRQEYGLRIGAQVGKNSTASLQVIAQSDVLFNIGKALIADLILRFNLTDWLQLAAGAGTWADLGISPLGMKRSYSKLTWGMAILF